MTRTASVVTRPPRASWPCGVVVVAEQAPVGELVDAAVAERVAAHHPPGGDDRAAHDARAPAPPGPRRSSSSGSTCSAAPGSARSASGRACSGSRKTSRSARETARSAGCRAFHVLRRLRARRRRAARARRGSTPRVPSRSTRPATSGRATSTKSCSAGKLGVEAPEGLAQRPLDRVALHGPADLAADRDPERGPRRASDAGARERVEDQEAVGVRAAVAIDAVEVPAARQPAALAALAHPGEPIDLRRQPLAALGAGGAGARRGPERVRIRARKPWVRRALALLRLPGALHRIGQSTDGASEVAPSPACSRDRGQLFSAKCGVARSGRGARMYGRPRCPRSRQTTTWRRSGSASGPSSRASLPASTFDLWLEPLRAPSRPGCDPVLGRTGVSPGLGRAPLRRPAARGRSAPRCSGARGDRLRRRRASGRSRGSDRRAPNRCRSTRATPSSAS